MRILFMGTPEFSVFSLRALADAGENILGAVTRADKPKGRSYRMTPPPVKLFAAGRGIEVYQPDTLRGEGFAGILERLDPELIVVSAYGRILPRNVLDYPKYGCINIHGSLLPEYRGAAPIQRAIIDGKSTTGATIMLMDEGIDTGDMLLKRECVIRETDNFEDIHDRLGELGASALLETLALLREGRIIRTRQDEALASYAPKIEKSDCHINFNKSAQEVHNLIRGLSPIPLAFARIPGDCILKVAASEVAGLPGKGGKPGTVIALDEGIVVACGEGAVRLLRVTPECRCCMCAADFIRGRGISLGDTLF